MLYRKKKPSVQILESKLKSAKRARELVTASLLECENFLLTYDSNRDEDERLQEIYYYQRKAEDLSRKLRHLDYKIKYLKEQLELAKSK